MKEETNYLKRIIEGWGNIVIAYVLVLTALSLNIWRIGIVFIFLGVIFAIVSIISFVQADNIKKRVERRQMIREAIIINKLKKRKSKARRKRR